MANYLRPEFSKLYISSFPQTRLTVAGVKAGQRTDFLSPEPFVVRFSVLYEYIYIYIYNIRRVYFWRRSKGHIDQINSMLPCVCSVIDHR